MHPVGPHSSGVYWVRRALAAAVAVAVVGGVVGWIAGRGSADPDVDQAATVTTTTPPLTGVLAPTDDGSAKDTGLIANDTAADTGDGSGDGFGEGAGDAGTGTEQAGNEQAGAAQTGPEQTGTTGESADQPDSGAVSTTGEPVPADADAGSSAAAGSSAGDTAADVTSTQSPAVTSQTAKSASKKSGEAADAISSGSPKPSRTSTKTTRTTAPTTTAPPKPSYDERGRLICADSAITVRAITQSSSFPVGTNPRLGMAVTNTGSQSCVRDLSGTLQSYTVFTASGDRVWSTDDCFPGEGHEVRELGPGATANFIVKWSGTTSEPGCAAPRSPVPAGKYVLVAKLGKIKSAKLAFVMR